MQITDNSEQITDKNGRKKPSVKKKSKSEDLCVYLGPTIHGVIVSGAVYANDKNTVLGQLAETIKTYPLIAGLIVSGDSLPESIVKIKTPGNLLYADYQKFVAGLNQGGGN